MKIKLTIEEKITLKGYLSRFGLNEVFPQTRNDAVYWFGLVSNHCVSDLFNGRECFQPCGRRGKRSLAG